SRPVLLFADKPLENIVRISIGRLINRCGAPALSPPESRAPMSLTDLQGIAEQVVNRARVQGFVVPREIRAALSEGGWPESQWRDVLALAQGFLHYRHGRYYYISVANVRPRNDQVQQRDLQQAVRQIMHEYRVKTTEVERRQHGRVPFVQPTKIITPDHREMHLLSRDISPTGIRLIGTRNLQGQKVRVLVPRQDEHG